MVGTDINLPGEENLELVLVTASMNHEYAKKEYDKSQSFHRKEELMTRMSHLKSLYFNVRQTLEKTQPDRLAEIEEELRSQKEQVFHEYLV
ncbi:MAG: hypothetical protein HYY44_02290 [Deltaproteobacteria bacterium]|nr:hypothetical protein [Deltaproteobacteria bacterium]MBI4373609.1 hypothetical protein [Deltaproteobacteria bacterium]